MPEPIVDRADGTDPEHEALLADSVGLALLVVLETLTPAERLAFVLHDMFARAVRRDRADRRPLAGGRAPARQPRPPPRPGRARRFPTPIPRRSARSSTPSSPPRATGDFEALLEVLDPDVVLRADLGAARRLAGGPRRRGRRGPGAARTRSSAWSSGRRSSTAPPASSRLRDGEPFSVGAFTIRGGRIVEIDILADPERLRRLDLTILDGDPEAANDL